MRSPRADHPFHVSQLFIILDRTELLLDVFATGLEDGTYPRTSVELVSFSSCSQQPEKVFDNLKLIRYTCMCRFFAHFCFFLQMIDIPVPLSSTKIIIESYLEVLEVCISPVFFQLDYSLVFDMI
jgi:nuclear pore complex protein Nup107